MNNKNNDIGRILIISIMPHGPAYDFSPNESPPFYWENSIGNKVGFWPREWLHYIGEAVLKETDRYSWEVWQPDYRADKIYSKTLQTGVVHRLFPSEENLYRHGWKPQTGFLSHSILSRLKDIQGEPMILLLYGTYGFHVPFYHVILEQFGPYKKFPIFYRSGGMFRSPLSQLFSLHRPLTYLNLIIQHFYIKRLLRYVDIISEQSEMALKEVREIYSGRVEKLTMGCDFDFWIPVESDEIKSAIRKKLDIPYFKKVFFASGNFQPRKQLDRLIEVFLKIRDRDDFFLIIAGHGDRSNTEKLNTLISPLVEKKQALIHPYVTGEDLRRLYWLSDIYVSVATDEGGPVSVMKAIACGLPILSTPVGETADRMKNNNVGRFIPIKRYTEWQKAIIEILEYGPPKPMGIDLARSVYHWPNVADRFIKIFDDLLKI
ncbi:MAG: hypothetical protein A2Y97_02340 [Nitrospirae bacterium RBG_13_39_12]|nr:MAG: hypothetical protein A2Y97_02340 [Nitrospirae bacterium RBG_13_39_12]